MTEWIKCSDRLPEKEGKLLVNINGKYFVCSSIKMNTTYHLTDEIGFIFATQSVMYNKPLENTTFSLCCKDIIVDQKWHKPPHFAEITHWMYIEEPND